MFAIVNNVAMNICVQVFLVDVYFHALIAHSFFFYFLFFNFYCYSITVVCLFSPSLHPTPAEPTTLPHLHPPPWFCPCVLYSSSCNPLSSLSPAHSSLPIVRLFFFFFNFYCYSITVVCLFSPSLHPTPAEPTSLPHLHPPPWFCPCVLYSSSCKPLSSLSPPYSPWLLLDCS